VPAPRDRSWGRMTTYSRTKGKGRCGALQDQRTPNDPLLARPAGPRRVRPGRQKKPYAARSYVSKGREKEDRKKGAAHPVSVHDMQTKKRFCGDRAIARDGVRAETPNRRLDTPAEVKRFLREEKTDQAWETGRVPFQDCVPGWKQTSPLVSTKGIRRSAAREEKRGGIMSRGKLKKKTRGL